MATAPSTKSKNQAISRRSLAATLKKKNNQKNKNECIARAELLFCMRLKSLVLMHVVFLTDSVFYFLNLDRCAYGGRTDASKYFPEKTKPVRGPTFVASFKNNCSKIYSYDGRVKKWKLKECNTTDLTMTCKCNAAGVFGCQSLGLLISFAAFCLLACEQSPN